MFLYKTPCHQFHKISPVIMPLNLNSSRYTAKALHYTLHIKDRAKNIYFFCRILGMTVIRHEEFKEKKEESDRSPDVRWGKTLLGYGSEDDHFVIALIWNSKNTSFELGNGFRGITVVSRESIARANALKWPVLVKIGLETKYLESPDGYKFFIIDKPQTVKRDPIVKVSMSSTDIDSTATYWTEILGMDVKRYEEDRIIFSYGSIQVFIEFIKINEAINHGRPLSRILFSVRYKDLKEVETRSKDLKQTMITPMTRIKLQEKHPVYIAVVTDTDEHQICYVVDEGFKRVSQCDSKSEPFLYYCMKQFEKEKKSFQKKYFRSIKHHGLD